MNTAPRMLLAIALASMGPQEPHEVQLRECSRFNRVAERAGIKPE